MTTTTSGLFVFWPLPTTTASLRLTTSTKMVSFVVVFEPVFAAPLVAVDVFAVVLAVELSLAVSIVESNMAQPILY